MPTIKDKLKFNFNGVWSDSFGLISIELSNGMFEETFVASRDIVETKMQGNNKPLLHHIEDSPLEFEMTIAFQNGYTDSSIDSIVRWLFVDSYKPLYFEGKEDKVYMAMPIGESSISHNGIKQGYFKINMRCDSPNVYSPLTESPIYTIVGSRTITVNNGGHFEVYPEISIVKNGTGTITLQNVDDVGNIFEIRDLTNEEDIYINCEKEIIETDIVGEYRYDNLIGDFPRLVYGDNRFVVTGSCTIQFRYKNKYRF